jgi:hypothetical protein
MVQGKAQNNRIKLAIRLNQGSVTELMLGSSLSINEADLTADRMVTESSFMGNDPARKMLRIESAMRQTFRSVFFAIISDGLLYASPLMLNHELHLTNTTNLLYIPRTFK